MSDQIRLDDDKLYHVKLLDENKELLFSSLVAGKEHEQKEKIQQLQNMLLQGKNYLLVTKEDHVYVQLTDFHQKPFLQSEQHFLNEEEAVEFVDKCLDYFEEVLTNYKMDKIVTLQELKAPNAEDLNNQLSIVYPNWTARFNNEAFFELFKQVLFSSVPAHLQVKLVGLRYQQMKKFEDLYYQYKDLCATQGQSDGQDRNVLAKDLLDFLLSHQTQ